MGPRTLRNVLHRIRALLTARLQAQGKGKSPIAALWSQALLAAAGAAILRGEVSAWAFAAAALCVSAFSVALPLLGELAPLLGDDESGDWLKSQPVRALEVRIARSAHLALLLLGLGLASGLPWALLAVDWSLEQRAALVLAALGQAWTIAAVLVLVRSAARDRATWILVGVQTALWSLAILGSVFGPRLALRFSTPESLPTGWPLRLAPPLRLAEVVALETSWRWTTLTALIVLALGLLVFLPAPQEGRAVRNVSLTSLALTPLRRLARRLWMRPSERASFELVFDALPLEPDFALRAYPLLAVPLGFVFVGLRSEAGSERDTLLALLLFLPSLYLPLLCAHVPLSRSAAARWILETSPMDRAQIDSGARKAVAVRFVLPLYLLLGASCAAMSGLDFALRLTPLAAATAWFTLRGSWKMFVRDLPLSVDPKEVHINMDWFGPLAGIGLGIAILAALAARYVPSPTWGIGLAIAALALAETVDARARERAARSHL